MSKGRLCLLLVLLVVVGGGCWDYREINELALVTTLGLDRAERSNETRAHALIAIPGGGGGGGGSSSGPPALMESSRGVSLGQAMGRFGTFSGLRPTFSHVRVLLFGENLARSGLRPVLDVLTRWFEFRRTMLIMVARPTAERCLNIESPLTKDPTNFLVAEASLNALTAEASPLRLQDLLDMVQSSRRSLLIPLIEPVQGPHPHAGGQGGGGGGGSSGGGGGSSGGGGGSTGGGGGGGGAAPTTGPAGGAVPAVRMVGLAVFHGDRMIGTLDSAETIDWQLLTGRLKRSYATFRDPLKPKDHLTLQWAGVERRVTAKRGARPSLRVALNITAETVEVESGVDYSTIRARDRLEVQLEKVVRRNLDRLVHRAQHEFKEDIFGFGDYFVGKFLYWRDWENYRWLEKQFPRADIQIVVHVTIQRPGTTLGPIRPVLCERDQFTEEVAAGGGSTSSEQ